MAKKTYGDLSNSNQTVSHDKGNKSNSNKLYEAITSLVTLAIVGSFVWFVAFGDKSDDKALTDTTEQAISTEMDTMIEETEVEEATDVIEADDTEDAEEIDVSTKDNPYSFDGMTAEEIVALCDSFDDKFCIPEEGESEDSYNSRLKEKGIYELYKETMFNNFPTSNGIGRINMYWYPGGTFEHHVDGTSSYHFDSESENIICDSLSDADVKGYLTMELHIKDYDIAMSVFDSLSQDVKNRYGNKTTIDEIRDGDFYIVEEQDSAYWRVTANIEDYSDILYEGAGGSYTYPYDLLNLRYYMGCYVIGIERVIDL